MPQFELSTALSQVVWLAIIFASLFLILSAMLPKLQQVTEQRQRLVSDDLAAAERLRSEAEVTQQAYEAGLNQARARALELTSEVKDRAARATADRIRLVDEELEVRAQQAEERIAAARRQAAAELDAVAEQAAGDIVQRLTGRRPDPARVHAAVAAAIPARGGGMHGGL